MKIALVVLLIYGTVPFTEGITRNMWDTYSVSIQETVEETNEALQEAQEENQENDKEEAKEQEEKQSNSLWDTIRNGFDSAKNAVGEGMEAIGKTAQAMTVGVIEALSKAKDMVEHFTEAFALLLVTTFVLPLLELFILKYVIQALFKVSFPKRIQKAEE